MSVPNSDTYNPGIGHLTGVHGKPGTVLGPDLMGQWFAIQANDETGCTIRFATVQDIEAAKLRHREGDPQSVAEAKGLS